ncbi:19097_t:CDS:1, partial [Rhizophagus irregularis]
ITVNNVRKFFGHKFDGRLSRSDGFHTEDLIFHSSPFLIFSARLEILLEVAVKHDHGYIHRDFHMGNVL